MTFVLNLDKKAHGQGIETKVYKDILPAEKPEDQAYVDIFNKISGYTMTINGGADPTYTLFHIIKYIVQNRIPGDIVECGVWRGGSMMLAAYALQYFDDTSRKLYLYDTYAGMTEPDAVDIDFDGVAMKPIWAQAKLNGGMIGYGGTLQDVTSNMRQTGYPEDKMRFIEGDVLKTIPAQLPSRIALARLDTDWYQSTLHELKHMYDLIAPHGVLVIDDYGWCRGARQATDEFFQEQPFKPMMHRIDQSVRVIIKPVL